jgi:hypothetical protein
MSQKKSLPTKWMIRATVEMTPKVDLSHIKVIYADDILSGESLLQKLGIGDTCHIVLDHFHLLDEDIGAWPKYFGALTWSTQLREDFRELEKTYEEEIYKACLGTILAVRTVGSVGTSRTIVSVGTVETVGTIGTVGTVGSVSTVGLVEIVGSDSADGAVGLSGYW